MFQIRGNAFVRGLHRVDDRIKRPNFIRDAQYCSDVSLAYNADRFPFIDAITSASAVAVKSIRNRCCALIVGKQHIAQVMSTNKFDSNLDEYIKQEKYKALNEQKLLNKTSHYSPTMKKATLQVSTSTQSKADAKATELLVDMTKTQICDHFGLACFERYYIH